MAFIELNTTKLRTNYDYLDKRFKERGIEWGVVTKLLCGNELFIKEVLALGTTEIHDSRISNLRVVKALKPEVQTVYIKPPAKRSIADVVEYADVSLNTEYYTIKKLSTEAKRQGKTHKIIIMIELGDLREGVLGEEFVDFYRAVFKLPHIKVVGIGSNLNCLYGVMPSQDKFVQLSLYKELIKAYFDVEFPYISGGTSVVLPMLFKNQLPASVNHFRIGETLFFGLNIEEHATFEGMHDDVLKLRTEIIELTEKPMVPTGHLGLLDITPDFLIPYDENIEVVGASSDMLILDLGKSEKEYQVGDLIDFRMQYMGALGIMNSDYIEKRLTH